jgi:hypothetical protein
MADGLSNLSHKELVEKCERYQEEVAKLRILEAEVSSAIDTLRACADALQATLTM